MADDCTVNVDIIYPDENIGDSLEKINNNFSQHWQDNYLIGTLNYRHLLRVRFDKDYNKINKLKNNNNTTKPLPIDLGLVFDNTRSACEISM